MGQPMNEKVCSILTSLARPETNEKKREELILGLLDILKVDQQDFQQKQSEWSALVESCRMEYQQQDLSALPSSKESSQSLNDQCPVDQVACQSLSYSIKRLIRGLSTDSEAVREAFSVALGQILQHFSFVPVEFILQRIYQYTSAVSYDGRSNGRQDFLLARLFCFSVLIQLLRQRDSSENKNQIVEFILSQITKYSKKKELFSICCSLFLDLQLLLDEKKSQQVEYPFNLIIQLKTDFNSFINSPLAYEFLFELSDRHPLWYFILQQFNNNISIQQANFSLFWTNFSNDNLIIIILTNFSNLIEIILPDLLNSTNATVIQLLNDLLKEDLKMCKLIYTNSTSIKSYSNSMKHCLCKNISKELIEFLLTNMKEDNSFLNLIIQIINFIKFNQEIEQKDTLLNLIYNFYFEDYFKKEIRNEQRLFSFIATVCKTNEDYINLFSLFISISKEEFKSETDSDNPFSIFKLFLVFLSITIGNEEEVLEDMKEVDKCISEFESEGKRREEDLNPLNVYIDLLLSYLFKYDSKLIKQIIELSFVQVIKKYYKYCDDSTIYLLTDPILINDSNNKKNKREEEEEEYEFESENESENESTQLNSIQSDSSPSNSMQDDLSDTEMTNLDSALGLIFTQKKLKLDQQNQIKKSNQQFQSKILNLLNSFLITITPLQPEYFITILPIITVVYRKFSNNKSKETTTTISSLHSFLRKFYSDKQVSKGLLGLVQSNNTLVVNQLSFLLLGNNNDTGSCSITELTIPFISLLTRPLIRTSTDQLLNCYWKCFESFLSKRSCSIPFTLFQQIGNNFGESELGVKFCQLLFNHLANHQNEIEIVGKFKIKCIIQLLIELCKKSKFKTSGGEKILIGGGSTVFKSISGIEKSIELINKMVSK